MVVTGKITNRFALRFDRIVAFVFFGGVLEPTTVPAFCSRNILPTVQESQLNYCKEN